MLQRLIFASCLVLSPVLAHAASVVQVKGDKALIDVTDLPGTQAGETVYVISASGKKLALLKVQQVKRGKAIATIEKGHADVGQAIENKNGETSTVEASAAPAGKSRKKGESASSTTTVHRRKGKGSWGVDVEQIMTSVSSQISARGTTVPASMSGSALGLYAFYDMPYMPNVDIRFAAGYEPLNASGTIDTTDCLNTFSCNFKITYLGGYAAAKYTFLSTAKVRAYADAGMGLLYAMSKSSNAVNTGSIGITEIFTLEAGGEYSINRKNFIPFSLQYGMFPPTSTVTASTISIRVGYGWQL